jgi:hypothetical protein
VVFRDAELDVNWLADGFHRWHAHEAIGRDTIEVRIIEGSWRAALIYSLSANSNHGLQRGATDFRRAYEIAVSHDLVDPADSDAVRKLLGCSGSWADNLTLKAREAAKAQRDAEVIRLKSEGMSNREVGRLMGVAEGTVRNISAQKEHSGEIAQGTFGGDSKWQTADLDQDANPPQHTADFGRNDPPLELLTERAKESPRESNSPAAQNWAAALRALRLINEQVSVDELFDHYIGFDPDFWEELNEAHEWINEFWESYTDRDD